MIKFIKKNNLKNLVLFIHGFTGNEDTWLNSNDEYFPSMLLKNQYIKKGFDFAYFSYYSHLFESKKINFIRKLMYRVFNKKRKKDEKNLDIDGIAKYLGSCIEYECSKYSNIVLIAHSMGGLISKAFILNNLSEFNDTRVKLFISLAVPHDGSNLANLGKLFMTNNVQINDLEPLSKIIKELNRKWIEQVTLPKTVYFSGQADEVVSETSSISYQMKKPEVVYCGNEDHISISKPESENTVVFKAVKTLLEKYLLDSGEIKECEFNNEKIQKKIVSHNGESGKILYLYSYLAENGFDHISNRKLIKRLKEKYNVLLKYAIFDDKDMERVKDASVKSQSIASSEFLNDFNVLIIEKRLGMIKSKERTDRLNSIILNKFINSGGIVIFLSQGPANVTELDINNQFLEGAGLPLYRKPDSHNQFPDFSYLNDDEIPQDIILGYDSKESLKNGYCYNININEKYLDNINASMAPIFKEISNIVASGSIQISGEYNSLLLGNKTTRMICKDMFWDGDLYHIFGGYNDLNRGVGILITGNICSDKIVNSYKTDSIKFLVNLIEHLLKMIDERSSIYNN